MNWTVLCTLPSGSCSELGNCCEVHNRNAQYYEVHNITPVTEPAADRRVTLHLYYLFRQKIRNSGKKYILLLFALFHVDDFRFPWGGCNTLTRLKAESKGVSGLEGTFAAGKMRLFPWSPFFLRGSADFKDFATTRDLAADSSKK